MRRIVALAPAALGLLLTVATQPACSENGFCLDCFDAAGTGQHDGGNKFDGGVKIDGGIIDGGLNSPDACVFSGTEVCDGFDNDCNGLVDDGILPGVGEVCNDTLPLPCTAGTTVCTAGKLVCGNGAVNPTDELCDNVDNDCDNSVDEGNPQGGLACGTPVGECQVGTTSCNLTTHAVDCIGAIGPTTETCNGRDDDCDGVVDNGNPGGGAQCGPATETGLCQFGTEACVGGHVQCQGAVFPQVELCDGLDQDCDGSNTNGFDLTSDAANCGACGNVCSAPNAFSACSNSTCVIAACNTDYHDNNGLYADGCEYGPCSFRGAEDCNGAIDDDCDGQTNEDLVPPTNFCQQLGACAGTVPRCTATGWKCFYGPNVSKDGSGNIIPETTCDGIDNDCDGQTDEPFPNKGQPCDDGQVGSCRDTGTFVCNAAKTATVCSAVDTDMGVGVAETCDGADNDCDGNIDETEAGDDLNDWVTVGGYQIFKYEASHPDASSSAQGGLSARPCSKQGVLPWTNITHDQAEAQCVAVGAHLCTEAQWQAACETNQVGSPPAGMIFIEAENFNNKTKPCSDDWTLGTATAGFSGTGYMEALPNDGDSHNRSSGGTQNCGTTGQDRAFPDFSPRLDYTVNFPATGVWYVWVLGFGATTADDTVHAGLDNAFVSTADRIGNFPAAWTWVGVGMDNDQIQVNVGTTGNHTFNIYMREDGFKIDRILLTQDASFVPSTQVGPNLACDWSYGSNCKTYAGATCNGNDRDSDPLTSGDQDAMTFTGQLPSCFANFSASAHVFDMSGNVKEWTAQRSAAVNPIRGGSYNNTAVGISCQFNFLTANDSFFFENVGFRCCR